MRILLLSLFCACMCFNSIGQSFLGLYGTDNSVTQIRDNPAFAVHEDRAQINIFGIGGEIGGNSILFKRRALGFLDSGKAGMGTDYFRSYDNGDKRFWGNVEINGPGASVLIRKRYFFAITTGLRYLLNSDHLDAGVFNLLGANAVRDTNTTDSFNVKNYSITSQVFAELNLSYAGFLYESEDYKLIGGITLKLLDGIGAAGMGISQASFKTYNNDGIAYNVNGNANVAFSPYANSWAITNDPLHAITRPTSNIGAGLDLGLVYYMNPNETMQKKKGYLVRFAASITDIGSISYTSSSTTGSYTINNKNIDFRGLQNNADITFGNRIFNNYLVDTTAVPTGSAKKFKVKLPTALHLNADMKINEHFFVNANLLGNLRAPSADYYSNHYISTLSITPRYMYKIYGIAMPFSFNEYKQGYLGAILFIGPAYIGSGSLLQMAASNSINNANLYLGGTLRIKPKKPKMKDIMMME